MNRLIIIVSGLWFALTAPAGLAQQAEGGNRAEQRIEEMVKRLELTDEQREQVRPILQDSMEKRKAVLQAHGVGPGQGKPDAQTRRAIHGEMQAIREDNDKQLAEVLDEQQMQEFRQLRQELKEEWRAKAKQKRAQQNAP